MPNPDKITVAQLVVGWLSSQELDADDYVRFARAAHAEQQSTYSLGQLKYAEAARVALRTLKAKLPKSWHKAEVIRP